MQGLQPRQEIVIKPGAEMAMPLCFVPAVASPSPLEPGKPSLFWDYLLKKRRGTQPWGCLNNFAAARERRDPSLSPGGRNQGDLEGGYVSQRWAGGENRVPLVT